MGRDLKGKQLGKGISQRKDGYYVGRFTNKNGKRKQKIFSKLQECKQWLADAQYIDEHSNIAMASDMTIDAWFEYWLSNKKRTTRSNTTRNYRERYMRNISPLIGDKLLDEIRPMDCQEIMNQMADEGYSSSTISLTKIALYNMLDYAYQNEILLKNPCNRMVNSNIGKPSKKREALTIVNHQSFINAIEGNAYELQYKFILQTGIRTGELVGLQWSDVDFERRTLTISRTMEYRYSTKEWRSGPPKSESGNRTIPLTDEAVSILERQRKKNESIEIEEQLDVLKVV